MRVQINICSKMDNKKLIEQFDRKQKSQKHKRNKDPATTPTNKRKQTKTEEPEFVKPSVSYRDRAKERREGINTDFELEPDDIRISNPISETVEPNEEGNPIDDEAKRLQLIEDSKYLGGDVEHTHLVKGLDFALLEKVKNDQKLAEKLNNNRDADRDLVFADQDSDSEEEEFRTEAIIAASTKRQLVDIEKLKRGQSNDMIPCRTALARRILNVLDETWPAKSELFLPGRMSYVIPIDESCDDTNVTTILRSKADTSTNDETGLLSESDFAMDQLINILGRIRKGGSSVEPSKKPKSWDRDDGIDDYGY